MFNGFFLLGAVLIFYTFSRCNSSFTNGHEVFQGLNEQLSVAYDNKTNTILLFGGYSSKQQFITFSNHQFIDKGKNYLSRNTDSSGQQYTQIGHKLWMINSGGDTLFSVDTHSYVEDTSSIALIPIDIQERGCLTSTQHHLFVVGGGGDGPTRDIIQIYNIMDGEWLENTPNMNQVRRSLSCLVRGSTLFAIGGFDGILYLDSIEVLDISNTNQIHLQQWNDFDAKLTKPLAGTRVVLYDDNILVIGGSTTNNVYVADVNIIYPDSGICELWDTLSYSISYAASIIVNNTLFVFGGWDGDSYPRKYQYKILPTANPTTMKPSSDTSTAPTNDPSKEPSNAPSKAPSKEPSNAPSKEPSKTPSEELSNTPSKEADTNPSNTPLTPISMTNINTTHIHGVFSTYYVSIYSITKSNKTKHNIDVIAIALIALICVILSAICVIGVWWIYTVKKQRNNMILIMNRKNEQENEEEKNINAQIKEGQQKQEKQNTNMTQLRKSNDFEGVQANDDTNMEKYKHHDNDLLSVRLWFENDVLLPQYYDVFVKNGYNRMDIIQEISSHLELEELGISFVMDRIQIMAEIKTLKSMMTRIEPTRVQSLSEGPQHNAVLCADNVTFIDNYIKSDEFVVNGNDDAVTGHKYAKCVDCGDTKTGKLCDTDGLFYCNDCFIVYYE